MRGRADCLRRDRRYAGYLTEILRRLREYPDIVVVAGRVPGPHNLADMPSRGVSLEELREALAQSSGESVFRYIKTIEALKALEESIR